MRVLKVLVALILLGVIALAGYAYFGDMEPTRVETRQPVNGNATPATAPADAPGAAAPATDAPAETNTDTPAPTTDGADLD